MKKIRIFAASPSDMAAERRMVDAVAILLKPLADNLDTVLEVLAWGAVIPDMGRPEDVILDQLKPTAWDVFVGILWHRFGTPTGAQHPTTTKEYLSGTEEEFHLAHDLWKNSGRPRLMIYRCTRAIPPQQLDPEQFARVRTFFENFAAVRGQHPGLYQMFDSAESFEKLFLDNLQRLLLNYAEESAGKPVAPQIVEAFAPKIPDNLPRRAPFFGRDKELEIALRALSPEDRSWGVLVDGIGGIGKSALAIEAAYQCKEAKLFNQFVFVSAKQNMLAPTGVRVLTPAARTLDEFVNETAHILGQTALAQLPSTTKTRGVLDAIRGTQTLLIYDNLETLAKEDQEAVADFLRELPPGCKAITTSRRRGGEGGIWLRLEKLEWPAARSLIEHEIEREPQLAAKMRRVSDPRWQELYDESKGSPLALVHTLGLMRVRTTLTFDGALELLRGNRDPDLQRFIFAEARRELNDNDEAGLRAVALFVPSAGFEAWAEVSGLSRSALENSIDRLSALSLVDVLPGEERYALHPLTRNFVRDELLIDAAIERETHMRFGKYWSAYVTSKGKETEDYKAFDLLHREWPNIQAAADLLWNETNSVASDDTIKERARIVNGIAGSLYTFLFFTGRWDELIELTSKAYEAMKATNNQNSSGWRAHHLAWLYEERGEFDEMQTWIEKCAEAWVSGGRDEEASVLHLRGLLSRERGDYSKAEGFLKKALEIHRDLKNRTDEGRVLISLGNLEKEKKSYLHAERYFRAAIEIDKESGDKHGLAIEFSNLGEIALEQQKWESALEWFEKGLSLARDVGRLDLIAGTKCGLARAHEARGNVEIALPLITEAISISERLRHKDLEEMKEVAKRLKKDSN